MRALLIAICALLIFPAVSWAGMKNDTIRLVNKTRAKHGLHQVHENACLDRIARDECIYIARHGLTHHRFSKRVSPYHGVRNGEVLFAGAEPLLSTPYSALRAWLHSSPHRKVLLDRPMRDIGCYVYRHNGKSYYVVEMGRR